MRKRPEQANPNPALNPIPRRAPPRICPLTGGGLPTPRSRPANPRCTCAGSRTGAAGGRFPRPAEVFRNGLRTDARSFTSKMLRVRLMIVPVQLGTDSLTPGRPQPWSDSPLIGGVGYAVNFTPSSDGKRVLLLANPAGEARDAHVQVTLNFFDEIRRRLRTAASK